MTKVKIPLLNILIGLLIIAIIATLYVPTYEAGEKTLSVMEYLAFPVEHKDVTAMFTEIYEDFNINLEVWWLLLLHVLGACSFVLMALHPGEKKSLIVPILFALIGIGTLCFNRLVYVGGFTFIDIGLLVIMLLIALYNVGFIDSAADTIRRAIAGKPAAK